MFLLSLSIALIFVSLPLFLCKIMVVSKVVNQMVVQITQVFINKDKNFNLDKIGGLKVKNTRFTHHSSMHFF